MFLVDPLLLQQNDDFSLQALEISKFSYEKRRSLTT